MLFSFDVFNFLLLLLLLLLLSFFFFFFSKDNETSFQPDESHIKRRGRGESRYITVARIGFARSSEDGLVSGGTRFRRSSSYREPFDLLLSSTSLLLLLLLLLLPLLFLLLLLLLLLLQPWCCVSRDTELKITPRRIFIAREGRRDGRGNVSKKKKHVREWRRV